MPLHLEHLGIKSKKEMGELSGGREEGREKTQLSS